MDMKAVISNFRQNRHTTYGNHMIIHIEGVSTRDDASKLIGKKAVWTSPAKKEIKGEIRSAHGNSGAVRVIFETGMPGQAVGKEVRIE